MSNDDDVINRFKKFLRFETVSHAGPINGSYTACVEWLQHQAQEIGVKYQVLEYIPNKPILVLTLEGEHPKLPSILLNGHYDVVPVETSKWKSPPFEAVEEDNMIFARGTQDMKSVCMQYLEAVRHIVKSGIKFSRNVHVSFVPDEEIGGSDGVEMLIQDKLFTDLNIGMALDEGLASESDAYTVFYGERALWWLKVRSIGPTGHGSRFVPNTATVKLVKCVNKFLEFRAEQEKLLDPHGCKHGVAKKLGDVVTLNLTMLKSGVTADGGKSYSLNVIPMEAEAGFDIRIPPSVELSEMESKLREWTDIEGVSYEFVQQSGEHAVTSMNTEENPWWSTFQSVAKKANMKLEPAIFPAATDSRYLRQIGIPCFGFSPIKNTPILLHDHNEFIYRDGYLEGIQIYCKLIKALANKSEKDFNNPKTD